MLFEKVEYGSIQPNTSTQTLQKIISELLKQGYNYIQIVAKYNMCKNLYKKGTPEFYACMGVQPPPHTNTNSTNKAVNTRPVPIIKKEVKIIEKTKTNTTVYLLALGVLLLMLYTYRKRREVKNEV